MKARVTGQEQAVQKQSPLQDLMALVRSRTPIIAVESNEEPQVVNLVRQIGKQLQLKTFRWTVTEGMQAFSPPDQPPQSVTKSTEVLTYIRSSAQYCLFVLLDFGHYLDDPVHARYLKDIALGYEKHYSTVVLVGSRITLPEPLRPFAAFFRLPLPGPEELRNIVYEVAGEWGQRHGRRSVQTTNKALDLLVRNLAGLTETDARRLAENAIGNDGAISESEMPEVMKAKYELLAREAPLSFEYDTAHFADVGGMRRLRRWLEIRKPFFSGEDEMPLDAPRGLLLLGVQGCGKSLAAKAAAGVFGVPLLRLDFSELYSKYYGETEANLRRAFETAEVMAPCVLWVDEIEKGLAVADEDEGLSRRILGALLTWLSERRKPVFLVATANDISRLPPELIRKGRFDEVFFVDLPVEENRREIFRIHLKKRQLDPEAFDLTSLAAASEGFSGSEIEQALVSAMYAARAEQRETTQADVIAELQQTRPLSVLMAEKVALLRAWAAERTVPCD